MTPSEQERDARERVHAANREWAKAYYNPMQSSFSVALLAEACDLALDQYRNAVRRAVVAEAVAVVEGLRTFGPVETFDGTKMDADNLASWVNRYEVTTALRGLSPEGM